MRNEKGQFTEGHKQTIEARIKMRGKRPWANPWNKKEPCFINCLFCGISKRIKPVHKDRAKYCTKRCQHLHQDKGRTPESKKIRMSKRYSVWRELVYKRDNWTCQHCHIRGMVGNRVRLNAHHIKPFAHFPEFRFDVSNGVTLCHPCHKKTDTYGGTGRALKITSKWTIVGIS